MPRTRYTITDVEANELRSWYFKERRGQNRATIEGFQRFMRALVRARRGLVDAGLMSPSGEVLRRVGEPGGRVA